MQEIIEIEDSKTEPNNALVLNIKTTQPASGENTQFSKILIVDDNAFCLIAVVSLFSQYQIECDQAYNGQLALNMVKSRFEQDGSTYQLILMDYKMPICNGIEATGLIRDYLKTQAPNLKQPLIICTTSFSGK